MYPILCKGDKLIVKLCDNEQYDVGDIIVFPYKQEGLLIHRILMIKDGRYFCKGDNSFRIEDIPMNQVVGRAAVSNDWHNSEDFITWSLLIGKIYKKTGYQSNVTKSTPEYNEYKRKYLDKHEI